MRRAAGRPREVLPRRQVVAAAQRRRRRVAAPAGGAAARHPPVAACAAARVLRKHADEMCHFAAPIKFNDAIMRAVLGFWVQQVRILHSKHI